MKVYIVTQGEYSDYGIHGVFIERSAAEAFVAVDGGQIEEWTGYSELPARERWHVIEDCGRGVQRRTEMHWPWESPHYVGQRRKSRNYSKWQYGERACGRGAPTSRVSRECGPSSTWPPKHWRQGSDA